MLKRGLRPWKSVLIAFAAMLISSGVRADQSNLQEELIFFRDGGFAPAQIHRPAGPFLLAIVNRSKVSAMALRLVRQADDSVVVAATPSGALTQRNLLNLASGVHVMSETGHPGWTPLTITIQ